MSHAANPPSAKNVIANTRATAFVRLSVPRDIFVTSGSSRYVRITAMATGIRIGWRKLMTLAAAQITAPTMTTRRTTKQAVSAAHMVLRCHSVGYSFMTRAGTSNIERRIQEFRVGRSALDVRYLISVGDHYVGFVFGKSLLILFLVSSTFSARFLFFGSSVSAFCQAANASAMRFNFK